LEQSTIERLKRGLKLSSELSSEIYTESYKARKQYLQDVVDVLTEDKNLMSEEDHLTVNECNQIIKDIDHVLQYITDNDIIEVVMYSLVNAKDAPYTEGDVLKVLNFAEDLEAVVNSYQKCLQDILDDEQKPILLN
jgi:hypothetical protein